MGYFRSRATRKVSEDLSRDAGLAFDHALEALLVRLHDLRENPLPWKALTINAPVGLEVGAGEFERKLSRHAGCGPSPL